MPVFILTVYVCSVIMVDDISERVCEWQEQGYYYKVGECIKTAQSLGIDPEEAICAYARVS